MVTYLTIPILKQLFKEINDDKNIYGSGNYYHYYGVFLLTCIFLLNVKSEDPNLEEKLFKFKADHFTLSSNDKNNKFTIPKFKDKNENLEMMKRQVEFMKKNSDSIIETVYNTIEKRNKSDQEIIDMI